MEKLIKKLNSIEINKNFYMEEIRPGTTAIDLTASSLDLSDVVEELHQKVLEELKTSRTN